MADNRTLILSSAIGPSGTMRFRVSQRRGRIPNPITDYTKPLLLVKRFFVCVLRPSVPTIRSARFPGSLRGLVAEGRQLRVQLPTLFQNGFYQVRLPFGKLQCPFDFVVYFLFQAFSFVRLRMF